MSLDESLKEISLDELLELFRKTTEQLLESKLNRDEGMVTAYQNTLELIQKAIMVRRAESPQLK